MTVAIDVDSALRNIYAESAWHYATHSPSGSKMILNADRILIVMPRMREAFAKLCGDVGAYISYCNVGTFDADGVMRMEFRLHRPVTSATTSSLSAMISNIIVSAVLRDCYPDEECYITRYKQNHRALLSILAFDEQA